MSYYFFVILHQSVPSQPASRPMRTTEAIFVVCIRRLGCMKGCHSECCWSEEERGDEEKKGKKRRREKKRRSEERRCSEHRRNQFRAQQYREEKCCAWNVRGSNVRRSDSSYRSLLQWRFDPLLVQTTVTAKALDINHVPLFPTTGKVIYQFTKTFYPRFSLLQ